MQTKRGQVPSVAAIVAYWHGRIPETDLGTDWDEAAERCWCCGQRRKLEKAHIVPHALGGSMEPANLVLLCSECHRRAPDVTDPAAMLEWIWANRATFHDFAFTPRDLARTFADLYGTNLEDAATAATAAPDWRDRLTRILEGIGDHSGQLSAASVAWAIQRAAQESPNTITA
jgi:hypothetical protein